MILMVTEFLVRGIQSLLLAMSLLQEVRLDTRPSNPLPSKVHHLPRQRRRYYPLRLPVNVLITIRGMERNGTIVMDHSTIVPGTLRAHPAQIMEILMPTLARLPTLPVVHVVVAAAKEGRHFLYVFE
jgi:hypothetical protein